MLSVVKGLILRETQYKENGKLLTILTDTRGKITAEARGVKRKNSKLRSGCQLLCYSEFTLFENKGYLTINEADPIHMFMGLRKDIEKLALGSYFAQVLETIAQENTDESELLSLGLNSLYALNEELKPQRLIKGVFELRLLCLSGFQPQLSCCAVCEQAAADVFWLNAGTLLCGSCSKIYGNGKFRKLSIPVIQAMRYVENADSKRLFAFSLNESSLNEFSEVCEQYLLEQLEQHFSSLAFYKHLFLVGEKL